MSQSFDKLIDYLEKIIRKEEPLRQPPIVIIHCPVELIKNIYMSLVSTLRKLKTKHQQWNYYLLNIEKEIFGILEELDYIGGENYTLTCAREDLERDLSTSVLQELIELVENKIDEILNENLANDYPPFMFLLNMHSCYNYIQTKDIISRIISKEGILILILYLELGLSKLNPDEDESYKLANYNVHSIHIDSIR